MIIACSHCSSQIQVDDKTVSSKRAINCPKCNKESALTNTSPASEKGALAVGTSPSTGGRKFERADPAPLFELGTAGSQRSDVSEAEKLVQMLTSVLTNQGPAPGTATSERASWQKRKALVCTPDEHRDKLARLLAQDGYQVFVAQDTKQAVERMRENQLDVVLLDPQFDAMEQGAAFVVREVNVLRPSQRRRLFFVLLSPTLRTLDAHGAFLNNVNAIVNLNEIDDLVKILDQALRGYNELYKDLNTALNLAAI